MSDASDSKSLPTSNAAASSKAHEPHPLDALTGGAFSAPTSGERAARVRDWLATEPEEAQMQAVFKDLSVRDKGASRAIRERLDELKRAKGQEAIAEEWAQKASKLLGLERLNMADALAWQRDAAKAGAPLSREPLASLKVQLSDRVKVIEDLQHRVQVQREAAVLLAQRIEVLSTKPWGDAQKVQSGLSIDVTAWQEQAAALMTDANWASVEVRFPPMLEASKTQLLMVWDAFQSALAMAVAASQEAAAPLPPVRVWADELRLARGEALAPATTGGSGSMGSVGSAGGAGAPTMASATDRPARAPRPAVPPELRQKAQKIVAEALNKLERETAEGHGKASAGAASALRNVLKEHGKLIDAAMEHQVHTALIAAGELEGWQRWSADQVREALVQRAEALINRPEGQALGGRKMQETLRGLREQWKQTDQGGAPNHALWKRFDEACNQAHKVVEVWLEKIKTEAVEQKAKRLALIEELKAWSGAQQQAVSTDWKSVTRSLHQFAERWREAGHLSEKAFAEMQGLWKEAFAAAAAPIESAQKASVALRHALIEEAKILGASANLRVDTVRALQQRWTAEAQSVPLDRKFEQKLWDAFRKPIDEAFNRKTTEREKAVTALSEHDRTVLDAAKAVEAANASGDAQKIRAALAQLEAAIRGQAQAQSQAQSPTPAESNAASNPESIAEPKVELRADLTQETSPEKSLETAPETAPEIAAMETPVPAPASVTAARPRPVVAVRGDDRPGMKKTEVAPAGRPGRPGDRRDSGRESGRDGFRNDGRPGGRDAARGPREDRGPRLGDAAFRAQRDAMEHAQLALRKLAAQAHGEALTQLLTAWEKRDPEALPSAQTLGGKVNAAARSRWQQALSAPLKTDAANQVSTALLRLEMAAEVPTPAEHLSDRRLLQLQLLTRRNDPSPAQTWSEDAAVVLQGPSDAATAKRLQNALKALLR